MYNTMVCINECYIPYSGKLSREKTFANCEKYDFYEENIRGFLVFATPKNITSQISQRKLSQVSSHETTKFLTFANCKNIRFLLRKLSWIAHFCCTKEHHGENFFK